MLGLDNPIHLAFILILLLLVFGAKRLPEMGRSLGAGLRGFKESISDDGPHATIPEPSPTTVVQHTLTTEPAPATVVPHTLTTEPSDRATEPAHREPAGTAV